MTWENPNKMIIRREFERLDDGTVITLSNNGYGFVQVLRRSNLGDEEEIYGGFHYETAEEEFAEAVRSDESERISVNRTDYDL